VIEVLGTLTRPDGRPMLDQVIRKEEITYGPHMDDGPDLHVIMDDYRHISFPLFATDRGVISTQIRGDSGCHRPQGILIARGPHLRAATQIHGARIVDLAPTTLYLMGLPVPDDMDGRVLTEALTPDYRDRHPVKVEKACGGSSQDARALSQEEQEELKVRLKGLGYLG
jgi:predicted AlkP superfamily phosphohydrolase/phosphomutase